MYCLKKLNYSEIVSLTDHFYGDWKFESLVVIEIKIAARIRIRPLLCSTEQMENFQLLGELLLKCKCSEMKMPCFFERAQHSVRSASREISSAAWSREPEMLIMVIDNAGIWWLFMVWSVQPHSSAHRDVYPVTFIISSLTGSFLRQHFPWA